MRRFLITWKENKKYSIERQNLVEVMNPTGNIGIDCQNAVILFNKNFGSPKKTDIIKIQELDAEGNQIGEDITPMEKTNMMPIKKGI